MKANQSTQQKFIENVLVFAANNDMSKFNTIGSLEITKLIIYENKEIKALDDISLLQVIGDAKDIKQTFINNVLMYMVNFKISKIDGIGLIEVTKLLIFNTKF